MNTDIIGKGIYTIPQASKLLQLPYQRVSRLINGYSFPQKKTGGKKQMPPVTQEDLPIIDDKVAISFVNLIELLFVREFRNLGASLTTIRLASKEAADILQVTHPFAYHRFAIENKKIFLRIKQESGDIHLIELAKKQYCIEPFIKQFLHDIEFDEITGLASRWYPLGKDTFVVLDPQIAFGAPTIDGTRITTDILFGAFEAENTFDDIAKWYEIDAVKVEAAIKFHQEVIPI